MNSVRVTIQPDLSAAVDVTIQPMNRLMCVVAWSPSTIDVDGGCKGSIAAHSAWSCDPYRSATTTFTVCRGWPAGLRPSARQAQVGRQDIIFIKRHSQASMRI